MEFVTVKVLKEEFETALNSNVFSFHEIKDIKVVDDLFKDDEIHKALKKASVKAFKAVEEYEFKKRHNIK